MMMTLGRGRWGMEALFEPRSSLVIRTRSARASQAGSSAFRPLRDAMTDLVSCLQLGSRSASNFRRGDLYQHPAVIRPIKSQQKASPLRSCQTTRICRGRCWSSSSRSDAHGETLS